MDEQVGSRPFGTLLFFLTLFVSDLDPRRRRCRHSYGPVVREGGLLFPQERTPQDLGAQGSQHFAAHGR